MIPLNTYSPYTNLMSNQLIKVENILALYEGDRKVLLAKAREMARTTTKSFIESLEQLIFEERDDGNGN